MLHFVFDLSKFEDQTLVIWSADTDILVSLETTSAPTVYVSKTLDSAKSPMNHSPWISRIDGTIISPSPFLVPLSKFDAVGGTSWSSGSASIRGPSVLVVVSVGAAKGILEIVSPATISHYNAKVVNRVPKYTVTEGFGETVHDIADYEVEAVFPTICSRPSGAEASDVSMSFGGLDQEILCL